MFMTSSANDDHTCHYRQHESGDHQVMQVIVKEGAVQGVKVCTSPAEACGSCCCTFILPGMMAFELGLLK